jgi:hypothetical protein
MPLGIDHVPTPSRAMEKARVEFLCEQMKATAADLSRRHWWKDR